MATSAVTESAFSGRSGFVLRFQVNRIGTPNTTTNRWHVEVHVLNRSGATSFDLTPRPWSVSGTFGSSGTWVPDFRGTNDILLWQVDVNVGTNSDGYSSLSWTASAGPAGIFGSASLSGGMAADRIPQVPDATAAPKLYSKGSDYIIVSMPQPSDNGGSAVTEYLLQADDTSNFTSPVLSVRVGTGSLVQTIPNLAPNRTYYIRQQARNSVGPSNWSPTLTVVTNVGPPSAPLNPRILDVGPSSITVDWDAVASAGGGTINEYIVQRATNSAMTANLTEFNVAGAATTQLTVGNLPPSTPYWFRVIAANSAGRGPASPVVTATTISGAYVWNGSTWKGAGIFVSNGADWVPVTIKVSRDGTWIDAV